MTNRYQKYDKLTMACNCERKERLLGKLASANLSRLIYMDYNATTPVLNQCLGAFEAACRSGWGNPSSIHPSGARAWDGLEKNRSVIAKYFLSSPEEIHFCSSGSEALFAAIHGLSDREKNTFFITTAVEHPAVLKNITDLPARRFHVLGVTVEGRIDTGELSGVLSRNSGRKAVIVYSPVNHETGGIQPVKEIYAKAGQYNATVVMDSVQAAARLSPEEWRPYCDIFALSSHKLYSPKGCGILSLPEKTRKEGNFRLFRSGGSQENSIFPGTENTPGIAAFAKAVEYLSGNFESMRKNSRILTAEGIKILKNLPFEIIIESPSVRAEGILCLSIPEIRDMESFLEFLHLRGICISRFSACSENMAGPSAVLEAMGRERKRSEKSIRISTGLFSKREDYFALSDAIRDFFTQGQPGLK